MFQGSGNRLLRRGGSQSARHLWFPKFETQQVLEIPECVARVPVSLWGCGGEAVFTKGCVCARNRSQPSATVRNRLREARKISTVASASGPVPKACPVDSCRRNYTGVCRGGICVTHLWRRIYIGV